MKNSLGSTVVNDYSQVALTQKSCKMSYWLKKTLAKSCIGCANDATVEKLKAQKQIARCCHSTCSFKYGLPVLINPSPALTL